MAENLGNLEGIDPHENNEAFSSPMDFIQSISRRDRAAKRKKQSSGSLDAVDQPSISNTYQQHNDHRSTNSKNQRSRL